MSNIFKGYSVSVEESSRVVDVNDIIARKLQEEEEKRIRLQAISDESYDSDEFFEGLPAENIDALLDEEAESAVIKSANREELERIDAELQSAKDELASIKEEAQGVLEDAYREAEDVKAKAYDEGHREGYEVGYNEGMNEISAMKQELQRHSEELENDYREKIVQLEPEFVDALTDIYEHIFCVDLDTYRGIVSHLLVDAINNSEGAKNIMVHVSREDYLDVYAQKEDILAQTGMTENNVEFVQDATLPQGGCLIETDSGVFDCSLETELKELKRKLMLLSYRRE